MLLANIPNILHVQLEAYYHSLFLLLMRLLGFDIQGELMTNIGRIDAVWNQRDTTVIAEIKYSADKTHDKLLEEAMTQIVNNKYYEAYADRKIILMAIAFANKEVKCKMETFKNDELADASIHRPVIHNL
jgi:predicted subunit of tRNA(5-methylaminomethyl-2-thiouridylate) methyltransferase